MEDALEFAAWLRAATGDEPLTADEVRPGALLQFAEPHMAVELVSRNSSTITTQWYFFDPTGPVLDVGYTRLNARVFELASPRAGFRSSAETWGEELAAFVSP